MPPSSTRVGVVSDTHGLVRPEALAALRGSDMILHGGDIGGPDVLEALRELAPLFAVRGNNDRAPWAAELAELEQLELGGARVCLLHDRKELPFDPALEGVDIVVSGHTHRPRHERRDGVLWANPGSAGPRRFRLPVGLGRLTLAPGRAPEWEWIELVPAR